MDLFVRDVVVPIWPNLAASVLFVGPGFIIHHLRLDRRNQQRHEELKAHIADQMRSSDG